MSEGGTSATLPHGTYNVINHSTGERFENVQVPSSVSARLADVSTPPTSQAAGFTQQNNQADASGSSDQDRPVLTITIPAGTINNEPELNNGVVIDVEEVSGEPMADTTIEVRPEDEGDDLGFGQGMAVGGAVTGFGAAIANGIVSTGLGVMGLGLTAIGLATAFFDFGARPTNPQTGHNSIDNSDSDLNGDGFVSGAESAEAAGFGTAEEREFGGSPTAPDPEPASTTTTTVPASTANQNSENDTDNGAGGGGVSSGPTSSESAEQGGYGNSEAGEFG